MHIDNLPIKHALVQSFWQERKAHKHSVFISEKQIPY
jgi:hypothetical protein